MLRTAYSDFKDFELSNRLSLREYQIKANKEMLERDIPISLRNDLSLENALIKKDFDMLHLESNQRFRKGASSMLSQSTLEIEAEG